MTQTHDEQTVERVAFLRAQHEQSCFELGEHPMEYDTPYSAGADALERLSALPPQEVSVQEAAKVLMETREIVSEAAETGFNCHDGDWAERLFKNNGKITAALRALSEGKA